SGTGKSVLLRQIIGIEQPDEGFVEIDGVNITVLKPSKRIQYTKKMGMLFQGAALFDSMDVGDNTAFYLNQHEANISKSELDDRVATALKMVGLENTQKKMPSDLSGGMRKRAGLARLIVYRPHILLYDEPTTGLDPITSMQINELINQIKEELKATSIVITHDIKSAMVVGDTLAFQNEGVIEEIAPKHDFVNIQNKTLQTFFKNATLTQDDLR
ncbi:MAG: ABC transporter ATP-binding protein, partial [Parachlamydiaceae bacterium]